jgi:hypothetical protein
MSEDFAARPVLTCECGRRYIDLKAFTAHYYERCPDA